MSTSADQNPYQTLLLVEYIISIPECILSALGALMIILSVFRSKVNRTNIQQKLIGFMSISDFVLPFLRLTGHLFIPSDHGPGYVGNDLSCRFQGFFNAWAFIATMAYNGCLAIYYLLTIKYNWRPRQLQSIEKYFYWLPHIPGFIFAALAFGLDVENPPENYYARNICVVQYDRDFSELGPDDPKYKFKRIIIDILWYLYASVYLSIILLNIICIALIYFHVRKTETKGMKWKMANARQLVRTKQVAINCMYFAVAFFVPGTTYIFVSLMKHAGVPMEDQYLALLYPFVYSAGFLNALVYFRLRYNRMREEGMGFFEVVWEITRHTFFPCCNNLRISKREQNIESQSGILDDDGDCEPELSDYVEPNSETDDVEKEQLDYLSELEFEHQSALSEITMRDLRQSSISKRTS